MKHIIVGKKGEKVACSLLKSKNFKILCRNYKPENHSGEIDIVARDGSILCFIEVKTRYSSRITEKIQQENGWLANKQAERIKNAARDYLKKLNTNKIKYRFDLIEIMFGKFGIKRIYHWETNFGLN